MKHKTIALTQVKAGGDLGEGTFTGLASAYGNVDLQGDRVVKGAFATTVKEIEDGTVVPVLWQHRADDPRSFIGQIMSARETDKGLEITGQLDTDTEHGAAAFRQVKSRRITAMSIGYTTREDGARKSSDGARELVDLDLREVSLVVRPANPAALIGAVKAADGAPAAKSGLVLARRALAAVEGTKAAGTVDDEVDEDTDPTEDPDLTIGERFLAVLEDALEAAKKIVAEAEDEDRDLTQDEVDDVAKSLDRAKRAKAEIAAWNRADADGRKGLQYAHDVAGGPVTSKEFESRWGADSSMFAPVQIGTKTTRQSTTKAEEATSMKTQHLALGAYGRKSAAAAIVTKMTGGGTGLHDGPVGGAKALTSAGQVTTDVPMMADVVPTGRPATSVLDVLPSVRRDTPVYAYLRQNVRTLAAATVAPGAVKPTSTLGTETIQNSVSVVAHLSEPLDKFVVNDSAALGKFIGDEMVYGIDLAIQAQALNGTGTTPDQRGILATSGVQVQAFDTSAVVSIRKAMTKAEAQGYVPAVVVMRPEAWEAIELTATSDQAIAFRGVPIDLAERKLWGLTVVLSTALPAKTAVVLDPAAVSIDHLGSLEIEWAKEGGELFQRNQIQIRVECRIGVSVYQPAAVYRVATAA